MTARPTWTARPLEQQQMLPPGMAAALATLVKRAIQQMPTPHALAPSPANASSTGMSARV